VTLGFNAPVAILEIFGGQHARAKRRTAGQKLQLCCFCTRMVCRMHKRLGHCSCEVPPACYDYGTHHLGSLRLRLDLITNAKGMHCVGRCNGDGTSEDCRAVPIYNLLQ
jgi:hypothetical protein